MDTQKKIFQHFLHVHFMEKLNEICLRDNFFFSKYIKYFIFWNLGLQMESWVSMSQFTNFKKQYSKKVLDAALSNSS